MSRRRAQKDARKRLRPRHLRPQYSIPLPAEQARIAEAAHRAVCEVTGTDGFGKCLPYAVAGYALLATAGFQIQCGSLTIVADPDNPAGAGLVRMDARHGGFDRGEYHCCLARQVGARVEVVDLSARHYRRYVEQLNPVVAAITLPGGGCIHIPDPSEDRIRWTRAGEPPAWLWTTNGHAQGYAYFHPDEGACRAVWSLLASDPTVGLLRDAVRRHYAAPDTTTTQVA